MTRERCHGHPGVRALNAVVRGMQQRAARSLKPQPYDGWVQFVDTDGEPFFYNFHKKERSRDFPTLTSKECPPCVLPARKLEPTAQMLANCGEHLLSAKLSYERAVEKARELLWTPRREARALELAHSPCPLDELIMSAQYLGINPVEHRDLMFLVDAMMSPELPVGWMRCADGGEEYYWNGLLGWAQWEHPQYSFLTGVAKHLKAKHAAAKEQERKMLEMNEQAQRQTKKDGGFWHGDRLGPGAHTRHDVHPVK